MGGEETWQTHFSCQRKTQKLLNSEFCCIKQWLQVVGDIADGLLRCSWWTGTGWPPPVERSSQELLPLSLCLLVVCSLHIWQHIVKHRFNGKKFRNKLLAYTNKPIMSSVSVGYFFTCFLWGVSPWSDVDISLSGNIKKQTAFKTKHQHTEISHYSILCFSHLLIIDQGSWCYSKCASLVHTHIHILWTCLVGNVAASLWWTDQWVLPCCSGGWWVWTQHSLCSLHH